MTTWVEACAADDIEEEDVLAFETGRKAYAVYRSAGDRFYASDGHCTHERELLCDGLVMDDSIECPKHNGRFDIRTGKALGAPVLENLRTYPVRVENGTVLVDVGD